jgi:hypothetical protein
MLFAQVQELRVRAQAEWQIVEFEEFQVHRGQFKGLLPNREMTP